MSLSNLNKKEIWTIVLLVGSYLVFQALADIGATKIVRIYGFAIPAGTFIFTLTFTLRDMLHKRLGKEWARATILTAGGLNLIMAFYLQLMTFLPSPKFFALEGAWNSIFGLVPSITIASIIAEVVSELLDTEIYQLWKSRFAKFPQWSRVLVSNAVSLPVDSLIFAVLAFTTLPLIFGGESLGISTALGLTLGQIVWKAIVTGVSLPGIYLVKDRD